MKINLSYLQKIKFNPYFMHKSISSVLVIIHYTSGAPSLILTKRSSLMKRHAGEISFPGGKFTSQDKSIIETATRETYEEIGLKIKPEKIIGCLSPTNTYTTRIIIFPLVVVEESITESLVPNEEVEKIIDIPLEILQRSISIDLEHSNSQQIMYKFPLDDVIIWGATARIIKDFMDILRTN